MTLCIVPHTDILKQRCRFVLTQIHDMSAMRRIPQVQDCTLQMTFYFKSTSVQETKLQIT